MNEKNALRVPDLRKPRRRILMTYAAGGLSMTRHLLMATLLGAGLQAKSARAAEPITWGVYTAAPYSMLTGADQNAGIFDRIRILLDAKLTHYQTRTVEAPFSRILSMIKDGAPWCFIGGIKTPERETFAAFSQPVALFYPLSLVVHRSKIDRFASQQPLSLVKILQDKTLHTSVLLNRSMGPAIDALIKENQPALTHSDFDAAMRMLLADRIDYLIEYANLASYTARRIDDLAGIAILPLQERPPPIFSRVMCPRTPWGVGVVADIDRILQTERPSDGYRSIVEAWSDPETTHTIRNIYDTQFLSTP